MARALLFLGCLLLASASHVWAQPHYVEVGGAAGIQSYVAAPGMGWGLAAADFDDDGDVDLFVPNAEGVANQLYRNLGNGLFQEIGAMAGLASLDRARTALWFDHDGDRLLDLFVAGDCFEVADPVTCAATSTLKLYRQVAPAQFQDVTTAAGIMDDLASAPSPGALHRSGAAAGDINNDGYLDLVFGTWGYLPRLLLNNRDGTFTDIAASAGLGSLIPLDTRGLWQPVMHDFDGDGWLDIYYAVDFRRNHLWINQGDNTFVDEALAAGVNNNWNDMGVTLGDYDADGDFDIYVTNIDQFDTHNILYRNDSAGSLLFSEVSEAEGVDAGRWGWGATFFDADRDGLVDLAATNGFITAGDQPSPLWLTDPSRLFLNSGGPPPTFVESSSATGFDDRYWGSSLLALDHDRDGDMDLIQSCLDTSSRTSYVRLLENQPTGAALTNGWLTVRPRIAGPNHRAIGTVVRILTGTDEQIRLITAGISFMGQEPAEAHFGLGTATLVDRLTVEWPDGSQTVHTDLAVDRAINVQKMKLLVAPGQLSWTETAQGSGISYDIVRGDLTTLRTTGDFQAATVECLNDDLSSSSLAYAGVPGAGAGNFFLVRERSILGPATFDEAVVSQVGSRDAGINSSAGACP